MPPVERAAIGELWRREIVPALREYVRIPCLSPAFDPGWAARGEIERAALFLRDWCRAQPLPGLRAEVHRPPGRTPALVVDVPASGGAGPGGADPGDAGPGDAQTGGAGPGGVQSGGAGPGGTGPGGAEGTVLVYGHLDKQPPFEGWRQGLGPFEPVIEGDRLYGRGAADDGYAVFAAIGALELLGSPRPRVVVLVEASEESGSPDLEGHLDALADVIGVPRLVICLDSGCLTYDRIWTTSSLRGNVVATVRVDVLEEGVHSGLAGGLVPCSFRVLRQLLDRIEDPATGEVRLPQAHGPSGAGALAGTAVAGAGPRHASAGTGTGTGVPPVALPVVPGLRLAGATPAEQLARRAWEPALAVTGAAGLPDPAAAGNVLRPSTTIKLSLRLAPTARAREAADALVAVLGADPPDGAHVTVEVETPADGWVAPVPEPWVADALDRASHEAFGAPAASYGEGGTIPFLASLGRRFPGTQLVATGVLGPLSNAHGPNEFLHLPMGQAVTGAVGHLVAAAARSIG